MAKNQNTSYYQKVEAQARTARQTTKPMAPAASATPKVGPKPRKKSHRLRSWLIILFLIGIILILAPFVIVQLIKSTNEGRIYTSVAATPARPVAIVFGAGLNRNGTPSPILADRLDGAISLYRSSKVERLLMTGDGTTNQEVTSMRAYALRQGVPDRAILTDAAGLRTYDSCYRAAHNFAITSAVLVTQGYHLPRALYLCNSLGIDSVGLKAGRDAYPNQDYYNSREFLATFLSWVDINIGHPRPEDSNGRGD